VSLITLIGRLCHLGVEGLGGSAVVTYRSDVLLGVAVAAAVVLLGAELWRVGLLFEERVWRGYARDVP
jgi:hypothetical protein